MTVTVDDRGDHVCEHGTAVDVHCCGCHAGFIFDPHHECPNDERLAAYDDGDDDDDDEDLDDDDEDLDDPDDDDEDDEDD